jgi:hypothetical protein
MNRLCILVLTLLISLCTTNAQKDTVKTQKLIFKLPLFDFPYYSDAINTVSNNNPDFANSFTAYANPSMHQSLSVTTGLYSGTHYGIGYLFDLKNKNRWGRLRWGFYSLSLLAGDYVLMYAPGYGGWLHEEFHRSVLTRFHVNSYNDINKFPVGSQMISVSHISDTDLINFKKKSPFDFIRLHVAGIEGDYLLIEQLQQNNFFYTQNLPNEILYIISTLNSIAYVDGSSKPGMVDNATNEFNKNEKDVNKRDFTGFDFTGWTYDLFRPDEPYTQRGIHPSGIGIDRYIKTTDLTSEQLTYLKKQGKLQWLNIISPMMVGVRKIKLNNNGLSGNFAIRNFLTSFGNDVTINTYLMNKFYKSVFVLHIAQNYKNTFPAVEAKLIDLSLKIARFDFFISPRIILGTQPHDQNFLTMKSSFLGLIECNVECNSLKHINPFIELTAKTNGWVAGNEFISDNFSIRIGMVSRLNIW